MVNKIFVVLVALIASATILIGLAPWSWDPGHSSPPGLCKDKPNHKPKPHQEERCNR